MDVMSLNANFDLSEMIENYETFAWTERYYTFGEFELTTYLVEDTMALLPIDGYISHSETKQVMIVEEHSIEVNETGVDVLTVTGRSVDGFMDTRYILNGYYSEVAGASPNLRAVLDSYPEEAIRYMINGVYLGVGDDYMGSGFSDANNALTPVIAIESPEVVSVGANIDRYFKQAPLSKIIRELLAEIDGGLKSDRVYSSGITAGKVAMWIYKGRDLTEDPATPNYVTFSVDNGDFQNVKYLKSVKNLKNVGLFMSAFDPPTHTATGHRSIQLPSTMPATISGFTRREMYINTVEIFRSEDFVGDAHLAAVEMAKAELVKNQRTVFITAELSQALISRYNVDYALGDLVTFRGSYGITASMQITEFTRINDINGERAYPTLTEPIA